MAAPIEQSSSSLLASPAIQFAWAAACERTGYDPISAAINSVDLLIGMLLGQPEESAVEQTFRHFGLSAGQALPDDYPRLTAASLQHRLDSLPAEPAPPLDEDVRALLDRAREISDRYSSADGDPLGPLWAAMLDSSSVATRQVRDLLRRLGVNVDGLASATMQWASRGAMTDYDKDVLAQFNPVPADLPNFKTDQPTRAAHDAGLPAEDFVGIAPEVDAFAYLIASRALEPPLAVGLFGHWGSGKSHFLNAVRQRIDQITTSEEVQGEAQEVTPFWKRIVQVDFNAWHYVEGDLWSSLVEHIFSELKVAADGASSSVLEERQKFYMEKMRITSGELARLQSDKACVEQKLECNQEKAAELERAWNEALEKLHAVESEKVASAALDTSKARVLGALSTVQLGGGSTTLTLDEALKSLASAREEIQRGRPLIRPILADAGIRRVWICFIALSLLVPLAIDWISGSGIAAAFAGIGALLAGATRVVGLASGWISKALDDIDEATAEVRAEIEKAEADRSEALLNAQEQVRKTKSSLDEIRQHEADLISELHQLEHELNKRPHEILHDFLRDRVGADEYRKRLGVPAIIRRDFKSLAEFVSRQNMYLLTPTVETATDSTPESDGHGQDVLDPGDPRIINRIVLYIDDLDRCPDARVVQVLQAVHLLLAFPLFVVVVAVDSRWLAHALRTRYPALAGPPSADGQASARPDDYLEKIFQVPFWVQGLGDEGRRRMVDGLLSGHVRVDQTRGEGEEGNGLHIGDKEARVITEMIEPRSRPPLMEAAALRVTADELAFLESLTPLMGDTPRSIKRFVNVYQLVKILRQSRPPTDQGVPSDEEVDEGAPSDAEVAAFLLAIGEGLPQVGWRLMDEASKHPSQSLGEVIRKPPLTSFPEELKRLNDWLNNRPKNPDGEPWMQLGNARIGVIASDVQRFLFRTGTQSGSSVTLPQPQLVHVIQD